MIWLSLNLHIINTIFPVHQQPSYYVSSLWFTICRFFETDHLTSCAIVKKLARGKKRLIRSHEWIWWRSAAKSTREFTRLKVTVFPSIHFDLSSNAMSLVTIGKHDLRVLDSLSRRLSLSLHNKSFILFQEWQQSMRLSCYLYLTQCLRPEKCYICAE